MNKMNTAETADTLQRIEKRLAALENRKKDAWDKARVVAPVLVPAAIALAGYLISDGIQRAEVEVAQTNARVAQAELVSKFMGSLTSDKPVERAIAVDAILIAIPGYGASLARSVAENDTAQSVQLAAERSMTRSQFRLIGELFSDNSQLRITAAEELLRGWRSDPSIIPPLLSYAREHLTNADGVYNTVVILNSVARSSLVQHQAEVREFLDVAETAGPKTRGLANQVRQRL